MLPITARRYHRVMFAIDVSQVPVSPAPVSGAMMSAWIVVPICVVVMLIVAAHVLITAGTPMPASRRRIRISSGVLMLIVTGLLGLALAGIDASDGRRFVMVWIMVPAMVSLLVVLALFDVINTLRLARAEKRQIDQEVARELARARGEKPGAPSGG
jgi:hypothetical protein